MTATKRSRQETILDLVRRRTIGSQEELRRLMARSGFATTQATLSRDLRDLHVAKGVDEQGVLRYQAPERLTQEPFRCQVSGNILVLHTERGMAAPLAYRIDASKLSEILGTVAGEDTVLAVVAENCDAKRVKEELWEKIGSI